MTHRCWRLGDFLSGEEATGGRALVGYRDRPSFIVALELRQAWLRLILDQRVDEVDPSITGRALKNREYLRPLGSSETGESGRRADHRAQRFFGRPFLEAHRNALDSAGEKP